LDPPGLRAPPHRRAAACKSRLGALLPAADRFPDETIIPYNLACYACQMNDLPSARTWLDRALEIAARSGDKSHWIETALHDPDLERLWPEIRQ
jgi:hypothetical protein